MHEGGVVCPEGLLPRPIHEPEGGTVALGSPDVTTTKLKRKLMSPKHPAPNALWGADTHPARAPAAVAARTIRIFAHISIISFVFRLYAVLDNVAYILAFVQTRNV
jgi:hypothetical protein